jgi:ABC-type proline/glycine betaine transport system substrate-binding protein
LKAFEFDGAEQSKLVYQVDQDSKKIDDVVKEWLKANEAKWKPWVEAAKAAN